MKKIKILAYLAVIATVLFACKASVEGEQKKFDAAKNEVSGLAGVFPRYTPIVTEHVAELDKKWAIAMSISGEEEKIKAMQNVNSSAKMGRVKPLYDLKQEFKNIEDNIRFIEGRNASEVEIAVLREMDEADVTLKKIKGTLAGAAISDVSLAAVEINGFISQMKDANKYIALAVKKIKDKDAAEKAAKDKAAKEAQAAAKAQEGTATNKTSDQSQTISAPVNEEVKMVNCKYCKTSNAATNAKCKNCGAAL